MINIMITIMTKVAFLDPQALKSNSSMKKNQIPGLLSWLGSHKNEDLTAQRILVLCG